MSVQYIGSNMDADNSKQFDITVERLATPQVNRGVYLAPGASDFVPGNYSFDLNTNLSSYEFQYTISGRDTNETVQDVYKRQAYTARSAPEYLSAPHL